MLQAVVGLDDLPHDVMMQLAYMSPQTSPMQLLQMQVSMLCHFVRFF